MAVTPVYVVLVRTKGLFLVLPLPNETQAEAIEKSLGLRGGYSAGLVHMDLPEGVTEAWVAMVTGDGPTGAAYFDYRAFPPDLTEEQIQAQLAANGEDALKLNRTHLYGPADRNAAPAPDEPPIEFRA